MTGRLANLESEYLHGETAACLALSNRLKVSGDSLLVLSCKSQAASSLQDKRYSKHLATEAKTVTAQLDSEEVDVGTSLCDLNNVLLNKREHARLAKPALSWIVIGSTKQLYLDIKSGQFGQRVTIIHDQ